MGLITLQIQSQLNVSHLFKENGVEKALNILIQNFLKMNWI